MIEVIQPQQQKIEPYYVLHFNYMIGDADGHTDRIIDISIDNPFLERFVTLLNNLKPPKNRWGFGLTEEDIQTIEERCEKLRLLR